MARQITMPGIRFIKSTANVSDPPTDAQIDSAFGTPAVVGSNFIGVIDDNDGAVSGDVWMCWTTGTAAEWFYLSMTKAL